jgi:hypothetical protein
MIHVALIPFPGGAAALRLDVDDPDTPARLVVDGPSALERGLVDDALAGSYGLDGRRLEAWTTAADLALALEGEPLASFAPRVLAGAATLAARPRRVDDGGDG